MFPAGDVGGGREVEVGADRDEDIWLGVFQVGGREGTGRRISLIRGCRAGGHVPNSGCAQATCHTGPSWPVNSAVCAG